MYSSASLYARFVREAVVTGLRQGLELEEILNVSGISLGELHQPDCEVSPEVGAFLLYKIYSISPITGLALKVGSHMRPSDFGHLGSAIISAPTVSASLGKFHKSPYVSYFPLSFTFVQDQEHSSVILSTNDDILERALEIEGSNVCGTQKAQIRRYFYEVGLMMVRTAILYSGAAQRPKPTRLSLSFEPTNYPELYDFYFHCPVNFSENSTFMEFKTDSLSVKPKGANEELYRYSEQQLEIIQRSENDSFATWSERTRNILKHAGTPFLDAGSVARRLGVSDRVLRRQLAGERTSFRAQIQWLRKERAIQLLCDDTLSIQEISTSLGYTEVSAFSRSFRKWTGVNPAKYRETCQSDVKTDSPNY